MRLILIRHGDPDYSCDGLTEAGKAEAIALAKRTAKWKVDDFYCSPMGRAMDTAAPTLKAHGREAIIVPWLREFSYKIIRPTYETSGVCWDFIPSDWVNDPAMHTTEGWLSAEPASQNPTLKEQFYVVNSSLDALLARYGYIRTGNYYINNNPKNRRYTSTVIDPTHHLANTLPDDDADPVIVFFCHFGISALIISHLINIPFPLLVHGTVIPTTGVTVLNTEERWDNQAYFRIQSLGDVSHLTSEGVKMSSAGSFAPLFQG